VSEAKQSQGQWLLEITIRRGGQNRPRNDERSNQMQRRSVGEQFPTLLYAVQTTVCSLAADC
jgi:hypothetical protein